MIQLKVVVIPAAHTATGLDFSEISIEHAQLRVSIDEDERAAPAR
jgi:hypothetical protein